jgi:aspartate kinase
VLSALADANVNVDMIIQNEPVSEGAAADLSFTVPRDDLQLARQTLEPLKDELGFSRVADDADMGRVSIVGAGMRTHPGVAARMFSTLGSEAINIEMISTSPIRISCVIREADVPRAVQALHGAFELGPGTIEPEDPFTSRVPR